MEKMLFLISVFILLSSSQSAESNCKIESSLKLARASLNNAKELYPDCSDNGPSGDSTECEMSEKSLDYLNSAVNLLNKAVDSCSTNTEKENDDNKDKEIKEADRSMDCSQILENGNKKSGVYSIWLKNGRSLEVFCDMDTAGGGWTVIQRRGDFRKQQDFYLDWDSYKRGFGNLSESFWLGNENIFALSNQSPYSIRFDFEDANGVKGYALYQSFKVGDEISKYILSISDYSGNVGDGMKVHNGMRFSTKDDGNDLSNDGFFCARNYKGAWWYNNCYDSNLNGIYRKGRKDDKTTVTWFQWRQFDCLTATEMKLKRI